jgi:DNA-binding NarL/FixJ family response regulator
MADVTRVRIRVALADDHPVVVDGLRAYFDRLDDLEVVGMAGSGPEVLKIVRELTPDVMVLDLEMPPPAGPDLIREVHEISPDTKVLVLTAHDSDENIVAALTSGASGYVSKDAPVEQVAEGIRQVHSGNISLRADVTSQLLTKLMSAPTEPRETQPKLGITSREAEVLNLLVAGATNEEIAKQLYMSVRTVKAHLASIFRKLGVNRRTSAATAALRLGLVSHAETESESRYR